MARHNSIQVARCRAANTWQDRGAAGNRGLSDIGVKAKHLDLTLSEPA